MQLLYSGKRHMEFFWSTFSHEKCQSRNFLDVESKQESIAIEIAILPVCQILVIDTRNTADISERLTVMISVFFLLAVYLAEINITKSEESSIWKINTNMFKSLTEIKIYRCVMKWMRNMNFLRGRRVSAWMISLWQPFYPIINIYFRCEVTPVGQNDYVGGIDADTLHIVWVMNNQNTTRSHPRNQNKCHIIGLLLISNKLKKLFLCMLQWITERINKTPEIKSQMYIWNRWVISRDSTCKLNTLTP